MGPPQSWTTRVMAASPSASTNWVIQSMWACTECAVRSSGLSERPNPTRSGAMARSPRAVESGHDRAVEIAPGRLAVQQEDSLGAGVSLVDVVHAQPVGEHRVVGREGNPGRSANRSSGVRTICTGSSCPTWHAGRRPGGLGGVTGQANDVAVVGAGLVGLSLAYELACLGTQVTVIDAAHPGAGDRRRGGHPLARTPATRPTPSSGRVPAPGRRPLSSPVGADRRRRRRY